MVYRSTERTRENAAQRREEIERAAHRVIARGGFAAASVSAVAAEAGCSTGLIYTYFAGRDELLAAAFSRASLRELATIEKAAGGAESAAECLATIIETFMRRAMSGRTQAYALLFEAVPASVQSSRRALRMGYADVIARTLDRFREEIGGGGDSGVGARCLVGAIEQNLYFLFRDLETGTGQESAAAASAGPESGSAADAGATEADRLIAEITRLACTAMGVR